MLRLKIQSTSDLITNSSSEVFVVKTGMYSVAEISELIQVVGEMCVSAFDEAEEANFKKDWRQLEKEELDGWSGMGRELEVRTWKEVYERIKEWFGNYTLEDFLKKEGLKEEELDQYVWIDIDHSRRRYYKIYTREFGNYTT